MRRFGTRPVDRPGQSSLTGQCPEVMVILPRDVAHAAAADITAGAAP